MTDSLSADIAALIKKLDEPAGETRVAKARLIVATDWAKAAMPLTALQAFRTLVPSNAPIELVFAVPHAPTEADAACIEVLADAAGGGAAMMGLDVKSFDEVADEPYDAAVVPEGDPEANLNQLGGFILRMRDLVRIAEAASGSGAGTASVAGNPGDPTELRRRLDAYSA